jgi:hypothetical protein
MTRAGRWVFVSLFAMSIGIAGCHGSGGRFASRRKNSDTAASQPKLEYRTAQSKAWFFRRSATQAGHEEIANGSSADTAARPTRPQITCPVDGKRLGIDSPPLVTVVNGEPVFVCSHGCEKKVHQDPNRYLARVRAEVARAGNAGE